MCHCIDMFTINTFKTTTGRLPWTNLPRAKKGTLFHFFLLYEVGILKSLFVYKLINYFVK